MNRQSHIPAILVLLLTLIVTAVIFTYLAKPNAIPDDSTLYLMLGSLFTGWTQAMNFWLGSNRKDQPADINKKAPKDEA